MDSQPNIVRSWHFQVVKIVTLLTLFLFLTAPESSHASSDKPQLQDVPISSRSSSAAPPVASGNMFTAPTNEDEANGDDGPQLKKDIEELNKTIEASKSPHQDNHQFYKTEHIKDPERAMSFWVDFSRFPTGQSISTKHEMLSKSYRRAAPLRLTFDFPYYGQPLRNIIVATGGFLYLGEHIHHWLAATQNIAPLMANFDLSTSNSSDIYHYDNGTALVVQWQDVQMKDNKPPVPVNEIPESEHPVKVGISDAFLIDKSAFFIRRKTIYDYHRLNLKDEPAIRNQSAIYLKALPTCNQFDSCETCAKAAPSLECIWCPAVIRCSNGYDRKRQEWLSNSCEKITKTDCSAPKPQQISDNASMSQIASSSSQSAPAVTDSLAAGRQMMPAPDRGADSAARSSESGGTAFLTFLMFLALTSGVAMWAFYAYRNPHTPSGQMLIKYRPSNWRWQNADARYTAASIHM